MHRTGLSILELLVVVAVIALLVAILLPAIQIARESARRASCSNKLHQIGLAFHAYEADHKVFPPGTVSWRIGTPIRPVAGPWNQNVLLLHHLGENVLYNAINLSLHYQDDANATIAGRSLEYFLCPSDTHPQAGRFGVANYKACVGSGLFRPGLDVEVDPATFVTDLRTRPDGFFATGRGHGPNDIKDGLSRTAAFSEMLHGSDLAGIDWKTLPAPQLGLTLHISVTPATQRKLMDVCDDPTLITGSFSTDPSGRPWCTRDPYTHLFTPGKRSCFGGNIGDVFSPLTASSRHSGGVNLLMGDASVRFTANTIDIDLWRALGSRNGEEQVDF
ncbi:MAG: DUF1559 domain-containing protein [Planctomycetes bacterium]|nr:DUF1559 domain-containing protein [Planctomycetota bacterium]